MNCESSQIDPKCTVGELLGSEVLNHEATVELQNTQTQNFAECTQKQICDRNRLKEEEELIFSLGNNCGLGAIYTNNQMPS